MPNEKPDPTADAEAETDEGDRWSLSRRHYLAGLGATAAAGASVIPTAAADASDAAPPDNGNWTLRTADDFDGDSLDDSNWALGWGWGLGAPGSKVSWARDKHVDVSDSMLRLTASHEDFDQTGEVYVGAVHSKNRITVEPPVYFEARCKFVQGVGWQNAFWSKPNSEAWPPEIDVVEYLQPSTDRAAETSHNLHYSSSGVAGDSSTHQTVNGEYSEYSDQSDWPGNSFHVYGMEWRTDALRHYVDGVLVEETTDPDVLEAFNNAGSEYLMLSLNLDNVGTTDKSESWEGREFLCDWVRVYEYAPDSGGSTGGSTEEPADEHYLWLRSGTGETATFDIETSDGNIRLDDSDYAADYQVSGDGASVSGAVSRQAELPGLYYEGDITDLTYSGPLEMYIDDQQVDPDSYVTVDEHYLWARSGDGQTTSFAFETSHGNVRIDADGNTADYWVSDDEFVGGGTMAEQSGLPGFRYDGDIVDLTYDGSLDLFVDNSPVDPASLVDPDSPGPSGVESHANTLSLTPTGDTSASYSVSVTDELAPVSEPESADSVSSSAASGTVDTASDEYTFDGDLSGLSVTGDAAVSVNGSPLDRLDIRRADGSSGSVTYIIETTGGVQGVSPSALDADDTTSTKIAGRLGDDSDYFWLAGASIVDVSTFGGEVVTELNGTVIDRTD